MSGNRSVAQICFQWQAARSVSNSLSMVLMITLVATVNQVIANHSERA